MEDGGRRVEDGEWWVEDGGWRVEDGGWRMEDRDHLVTVLPLLLVVVLLVIQGLHSKVVKDDSFPLIHSTFKTILKV